MSSTVNLSTIKTNDTRTNAFSYLNTYDSLIFEVNLNNFNYTLNVPDDMNIVLMVNLNLF